MPQAPKTTARSKGAILFSPELVRAARLLFFAALASVLYFAWMPAPPDLIGNDKSQHMLAFTVLTILFRTGFPRLGWRGPLIWMGVLGALIEFVQAIPALNRDCDIQDWFADMGAAAIGLLAVGLVGRLLGRR